MTCHLARLFCLCAYLCIMDTEGCHFKTSDPRNCEEWKQTGGDLKIDNLRIDPDGPGGVSPFYLRCDFKKEPATNILDHNYPRETSVMFLGNRVRFNITYKASMDQIEALIHNVSKCSQHLKYSCLKTAIYDNGMKARWFARNGTAMSYWPGGNRVGCACGFFRTCAGGPHHYCECEGNVSTRMSDEGIVTEKALLPIHSLEFSGYFGEGKFKLSPMVCAGVVSEATKQSSDDSAREATVWSVWDKIEKVAEVVGFTKIVVSVLVVAAAGLSLKGSQISYKTARTNETNDKQKIERLDEKLRQLEREIWDLRLRHKDEIVDLMRNNDEKRLLIEKQLQAKEIEINMLQKEKHELEAGRAASQIQTDIEIRQLERENANLREGLRYRDELKDLNEKVRPIPSMIKDIEMLKLSTESAVDMDKHKREEWLKHADTPAVMSGQGDNLSVDEYNMQKLRQSNKVYKT